MYKLSTPPHITSKQTTHKIMRDVIIGLFPAMFAALAVFGFQALLVMVTAVCSCVLFEYWLGRQFGLGNTTRDFSAIVTGILLALNLPATMPLWMVIIGAFMAIGVAKIAFGGIGKNIFNPALVGRVFLFLSFPVQMTTWIKPRVFEFFSVDASTAATPLNVLKHLNKEDMLSFDYLDLLMGNIGGSMGETSALAILIGFFWLLKRKIIKWHIPVYYIGSFALCMVITQIITGSNRFDVTAHILSGGLMLGAVFMATDYTTSPMTEKGKIIFAVGCGILTYIIRVFGVYPEGVSFAILIMNAFVPLIDKYCVQYIYGTGGNK